MSRLLLDTHTLIWWVAGEPRLGAGARAAIADHDNEVLVSAVSAFEITTKVRLGKLAQAAELARRFEAALAEQGFREHPLSVTHARMAGALAIANKDPFDRLLIAQALADDLVLVSNERSFDKFGISRLW